MAFTQKKIINENLEQSRYFKTNQNLPAWLQVQSFDYLDDHTVNSAVKQLINQFKTKEITELGTMLHMFHLMFLMSSINILAQSFDEILLDCKQYVDDLVTINKLPFNYTDDDLYNSLDTSAHGHGFWLRDEYQHHINLLRAHIKSKQKEALEKNYLSFANEILNALENDVNEFRSLLIGDGNKLGKYSQIDILSSIPHEDFVLTWLCLPYYEWDKIRNILINRYSRGIAPHILAGEKDWLIAVTVTLKLEALKLQGFERLRIERLVPTRAFQHI